MEKKDLEFALKLAQPCLLSVDFIPILSHYCFDEGLVYAYDDVSAVVVSCDTGLKCALRGDTLLGLVGLAGETVELKQGKDKVTLFSGPGSQAELPCLSPKDFLFQYPNQEPHTQFTLSEDIIKGFTLCGACVGKDPRKPEFTGVTLKLGKDTTFYASDNTSIVVYQPGKPIGKQSTTVIIPKSVCDQILATTTALESKLEEVSVAITDEFIIVQYEKAVPNVTIVGKLLLAKPAKFDKIIESCETDNPEFTIPEGFANAVAKVVLVIAKELQQDCVITTSKRRISVQGEGSLGKAETQFDAGKEATLHDVTVRCSPEHLTKMLSSVSHIVVDEKVVRMRGDKLTYYVAPRA